MALVFRESVYRLVCGTFVCSVTHTNTRWCSPLSKNNFQLPPIHVQQHTVVVQGTWLTIPLRAGGIPLSTNSMFTWKLRQ